MSLDLHFALQATCASIYAHECILLQWMMKFAMQAVAARACQDWSKHTKHIQVPKKRKAHLRDGRQQLLGSFHVLTQNQGLVLDEGQQQRVANDTKLLHNTQTDTPLTAAPSALGRVAVVSSCMPPCSKVAAPIVCPDDCVLQAIHQ